MTGIPQAVHPPAYSPVADIDLKQVTSSPKLLIALDFDGVVAPLQDDPEQSAPLPETAEIMDQISSLPDTYLGFISGRDLSTLQRLSQAPAGSLFIGSHGLEADLSALTPNAETADETAHAPLTDAEKSLLERIDQEFSRINSKVEAETGASLRVEAKPLGRTAHIRGLPAKAQCQFSSALTQLGESLTGVRSFGGHEMFEFAVRMETKGHGLRRMIAATEATAAVYVGDDTTDEDAFAHLNRAQAQGLTGLGIKVGPQETCAPWRITSPAAVTQLLQEIYAHRR